MADVERKLGVGMRVGGGGLGLSTPSLGKRDGGVEARVGGGPVRRRLPRLLTGAEETVDAGEMED